MLLSACCTYSQKLKLFVFDDPRGTCLGQNPAICMYVLIATQSQRRILWGCLDLSVCCGGRAGDCFQRDEVIGFPGRGQVETQCFQLWNCLLSSRVIVRDSHFLVCKRLLHEVHERGVGSPSAFSSPKLPNWFPLNSVGLPDCVERLRNRGSIVSRGKRFLSSSQNMSKREYLDKLLVYAILHPAGGFWRVQTMAHNTRSFCVFALRSSSGVL